MYINPVNLPTRSKQTYLPTYIEHKSMFFWAGLAETSAVAMFQCVKTCTQLDACITTCIFPRPRRLERKSMHYNMYFSTAKASRKQEHALQHVFFHGQSV